MEERVEGGVGIGLPHIAPTGYYIVIGPASWMASHASFVFCSFIVALTVDISASLYVHILKAHYPLLCYLKKKNIQTICFI